MNRSEHVGVGRIAAFGVFVCLVSCPLSAQDTGTERTALTGAWTLTNSNGFGPFSNPSLFLFTAKHFSRMSVLGEKPRAAFASSNPTEATNAEKIAAYDTLFANTGTYEISRDLVVFTAVLAKSPNSQGTAGSLAKLRFRVEGKTLILTHPANEAQFLNLTRVE